MFYIVNMGYKFYLYIGNRYMFQGLTIRTRLTAGFSILVILIIFIGVFAYSKLVLLGEQTENIYKHPLTVTRASLMASNDIQEVAILMIEMVQLDDKQSINKARMEMDELIKNLNEQLSVVEARILGAEGDALIEKVLGRINQWEPVREAYVEALLVGKTPTNEAKQFRTELLELMQSLSNYASVKADGFYNHAKVTTEDTLSVVLTLVISAIIIAVLAAIYLLRSVIPPLNKLKETVLMIESSSDLTQRINIREKTEIGASANAVDSLLSKFQESMHMVLGATSQLASTAEETSSITEQTSKAISQQMSETAQVASAISEMTASVEEVASSASVAASTADNANSQVKSGLEAMNKTQGNIEELVSEINRASDVIRVLETDSEKIGAILDVIQGIAEQTNLLALNAAIEAARAGEHGRGFAVVADEVRNLAAKTTISTEEINQMIHSLQSSSKDAVEAMALSQAKADEANTQAGETGTSLNAIATSMVQINDMSVQIASAAEQQASVTSEISENVLRINDMGEGTARASEDTKQASIELTRLASDLQQMVAQFKVS
jgi:methyl-accepting chemotaxis protein